MLSKRPDARVLSAIDAVPRSAFIASADIEPMLSGRTIPPRSVVEAMLAHLSPLSGKERALLVGAGAGYLAAILARLVGKLVVLEKNSQVADIAGQNISLHGDGNVRILLGEKAEAVSSLGPFALIVCICDGPSVEQWQPLLVENGILLALEGHEGRWANLIVYRHEPGGEISRRELGLVDFGGDTGEVLIDLGVIDVDALEKARREARKLKKPVLSVIQNHTGIENVSVYRALAGRLGLEFAEADVLFRQLDRSLFRHFSRTFLDNYRLLPVCMRGDRLVIATDNPEALTEPLEHMYPCAGIDKILVTPTDYRRLWSALNISDKGAGKHQPLPAADAGQAKDVFADDLNNQISPYLVAIYEAILLDAVSEKASDIHIERYGSRVRVRLRIDGDLHDLEHYQLTAREMEGVVNVIKTRGEINIAERRLPQGGRSHLKVGETSYDLRIQTQPSLHGEHVVIRLLAQSGRAMSLDELGVAPAVATQYRRLLDNPAGLVLIVGPTGSGKSTTLAAGLQELADDGRRKVITVEDPIEYAIDNIQQTHVRSAIGFSFADAMRSFVRQDPDVILVGEIRDKETALEAARASQTGHLVLSTLHCNDAVDAVQRLYDLGLHRNSIAGELLAVMAQRLAKRICPNCREEVKPDEKVLAELFPDGSPDGFRCYAGKGCSQCGERGTRGRVAVVEFMRVNEDFRDQISRQPSAGELRWRALDAGLVTMRDSALDLVIQGVIPLSELPRILPQERMAPEVRGGRRSDL